MSPSCCYGSPCVGPVGQKCAVSCSLGYAPSLSAIACGADGRYRCNGEKCVAKSTLCRAKPCTPKLTAGGNSCTGVTGDVCRVKCLSGYVGAGGSYTCAATGEFQDSATGSRRKCAALTLPGAAKPCIGDYQDTCIVRCKTGYTNSATMAMRCGADGVFAGGAKCTIVTCARSKVWGATAPCTASYGAACKPSCSAQTPFYSGKLTCGANGKFYGHVMCCKSRDVVCSPGKFMSPQAAIATCRLGHVDNRCKPCTSCGSATDCCETLGASIHAVLPDLSAWRPVRRWWLISMQFRASDTEGLMVHATSGRPPTSL